jgi:hypothetical protein
MPTGSCAGSWRRARRSPEVLPEARERLDERAAPGHDLRPAAGDEVDGRERLPDTDRVVRAEGGDGAREPDALRAGGRGAEHDRRRGHGEVRPVMLADAEDVEADLIGEPHLLEQVAQALLRADGAPRRRVGRDLTERVEAELHRRNDSCGRDRGGTHPGRCSRIGATMRGGRYPGRRSRTDEFGAPADHARRGTGRSGGLPPVRVA